MKYIYNFINKLKIKNKTIYNIIESEKEDEIKMKLREVLTYGHGGEIFDRQTNASTSKGLEFVGFSLNLLNGGCHNRDLW